MYFDDVVEAPGAATPADIEALFSFRVEWLAHVRKHPSSTVVHCGAGVSRSAASYRVGSTRVAVEVKCPHEEPQDQSLKKLSLLPAGHIPNYQQTLQKFKAALGSMSS